MAHNCEPGKDFSKIALAMRIWIRLTKTYKNYVGTCKSGSGLYNVQVFFLTCLESLSVPLSISDSFGL